MNMKVCGLVLPMPFDGQVHVRKGETLKRVLPATARDFGRAIIAPDTNPSIVNASDILAYRQEILAVAPTGFEPLITIRLTELTTPEMILEAGKAGAVAAAYYPRHGLPTAQHSFTPEKFFLREDWFAALTEAEMVLSVHAEHPMFPPTRREEEFLKVFTDVNLPLRYPRLRFVLESISTNFALDVVMRYENVAASVTAHHLMLTTDDVIGNHAKRRKKQFHSWHSSLPGREQGWGIWQTSFRSTDRGSISFPKRRGLSRSFQKDTWSPTRWAVSSRSLRYSCHIPKRMMKPRRYRHRLLIGLRIPSFRSLPVRSFFYLRSIIRLRRSRPLRGSP